MRPYLLGYGLLCVVLAGLVVATQLLARVDGRLRWLCCILLSSLAIGPLLGQTVLLRVWTGIALYIGTSVVLILCPGSARAWKRSTRARCERGWPSPLD